MAYSKYTFVLLLITFVFLQWFTSGWYSAILPEARPYEFLVPMLVALWIILQLQADAIIKEKRWLMIAKKGLISGTICGFSSWIVLLFRSPEWFIDVLNGSLQFGLYALVILLAFQFILGGWFIGLTSYFAVKEGCNLIKLHH